MSINGVSGFQAIEVLFRASAEIRLGASSRGVIEDVRGVVQDFVAPGLKAIRVELDSLKARFDKLESPFEKLEQAMDHKFEQVEHHAQRRHDETMFAVRALIAYNNLNQRLSQLEKKSLPSRSDQ